MRKLRLTQATACARPMMVSAFSVFIALLLSINLNAQCVPADGTLSGIAYLDTSIDGINDADESGVSNIMVTAYRADGTSIGFDITDDNGAYSITRFAR